jgi:hypothetical protein
MSGFTRGGRYGDRLVYEALLSKWDRYHGHCSCGQDWITAHAEPAGFEVIASGSGWVALVGAGLTINVDETALTTDALWVAVTQRPASRTWHEKVRVEPPTIRQPRSPAPSTPTASWYRHGDEWLIRAKDVAEGDLIKVRSRDGTGSNVRVGELIEVKPSGWCIARPQPSS